METRARKCIYGNKYTGTGHGGGVVRLDPSHHSHHSRSRTYFLMDSKGFRRELESAYSSEDECANTSPVHSPLLSPGGNLGVSCWWRREEKEVDVAIIGKLFFSLWDFCEKKKLLLLLTSLSGNGPSAILLSLLLSGHQPHLPDEHPNSVLNVKLKDANRQQSLLEEVYTCIGVIIQSGVRMRNGNSLLANKRIIILDDR